MQRTKRRLLFSVMLFAALSFALALLAACGKKEEELPEATPLAAPVIALDGDVVRWEAVSGATSYTVFVGQDSHSVTGTSYTVQVTAAGEYTIYVIANSTNAAFSDSAKSNTVTYTVEPTYPLAAPVISLQGNVVRWEAVEHAAGYTVAINGAKEQVTGLSYTIVRSEPGDYTVTVTANAAAGSGYADGPASNAVTYTVTEDPVPVSLAVSTPAKTVYYLDERCTAPDLDDVTVTVSYSDQSTSSVALSDCDVSQADMSAGEHELTVTYTEDSIAVEAKIAYSVLRRDENTLENVVEYMGEYAEEGGSYTVAQREVTAVTDLDGNVISFAFADGKTTIGNDAFGGKYAKVFRVDSADGVQFVRAIRATYITDVAGYKQINERLDGYYVLQNNIDFESSHTNSVVIGAAPISNISADAGNKIETSGEGGLIAGTAFTGVLDGNGFALMNFVCATEAYTKPEGYGLALFGWIGEGGAVRNLVLRNVSIHGGQDCAVIAAFNQGTIENIVVEETCTLYSNYGNGGLTDVNLGVIRNVNSFLTTFGYRSGSKDIAAFTDSSTYKNVPMRAAENAYFSAERTEIAALTAQEGWQYFEGVGTVYANEYYIYIPAGEYELPLGGNVVLPIAAKPAELTYAVYGNTGLTVDALSFSVQDGKLTISFAGDASGLTLGTLTLAVHNGNWKYSQTVSIELCAAVPVSAVVETQNIQVLQGGQLDLNAVTLKVTYSDGTEQSVHPSSVAVDTGTLGDAVAAEFFYAENGVTISVQGTVAVIEDVSTDPVPAEFSVSKKAGAIVIPYADGWTVAFDEEMLLEVFRFTTDLGDLEAWNGRVTYTASANTYGDVTFDFVYSYKTARFESSVTIGVYYGIADYVQLKAAGADGAAWYALTADIDCASDARTSAYFDTFSGVLDGNGYKVYNMAISVSGDNAGFIKDITETGVVRNLGLQGSVTASGQWAGAVAKGNKGLVENCYIEVDVHCGKNIGGVVYENYGTLKNNVFVGTLTETTVTRSGGVAGVTRKNSVGENNVYLTSAEEQKLVGKDETNGYDLLNVLAADFAAVPQGTIATFNANIWSLDGAFALRHDCLTTLAA